MTHAGPARRTWSTNETIPFVRHPEGRFEGLLGRDREVVLPGNGAIPPWSRSAGGPRNDGLEGDY